MTFLIYCLACWKAWRNPATLSYFAVQLPGETPRALVLIGKGRDAWLISKVAHEVIGGQWRPANK
jgi:hypothetical protein